MFSIQTVDFPMREVLVFEARQSQRAFEIRSAKEIDSAFRGTTLLSRSANLSVSFVPSHGITPLGARFQAADEAFGID